MQTIENLRSEPAYDPGAADVATAAPPDVESHPLDSLENRRLHAKLLDYWYTALDAFYDNRIEQMLDYDFYDHIQWSEEDRAVLAARHQAPLTYNKIKMAIDWVIGTERRTRIDGVVHPRAEDDVDIAAVKSELMKYLSDTNRVPWARSQAFKDAAIAGCGWTEESIRTDRADEPVMVGHIPWRQMRRDPVSRALDLSDCRFLLREKFADLDYSEAMFPDRIELVNRAAQDHYDGDNGAFDEELDLPQVFRRYDSRGHTVTGRRITGRASLDNRCHPPPEAGALGLLAGPEQARFGAAQHRGRRPTPRTVRELLRRAAHRARAAAAIDRPRHRHPTHVVLTCPFAMTTSAQQAPGPWASTTWPEKGRCRPMRTGSRARCVRRTTSTWTPPVGRSAGAGISVSGPARSPIRCGAMSTCSTGSSSMAVSFMPCMRMNVWKRWASTSAWTR